MQRTKACTTDNADRDKMVIREGGLRGAKDHGEQGGAIVFEELVNSIETTSYRKNFSVCSLAVPVNFGFMPCRDKRGADGDGAR